MSLNSDVVIRVERLGKMYTIQHSKTSQHNTLRDVIAHQGDVLGRWLNPFTIVGQLRKAKRDSCKAGEDTKEDFWALKDVNFEIRRGERVGIIGRNGAGKSTLLKILSRITEPTTGRVEICGRLASLLEVGTGFHPELTGRENIYLNGAILGMTRREIKLRFDEIVDFSEVEKFLDTPVKRYSSGMYVRLAFSVAAHLEPEILVVDEVLAVGDASFQKKCLGKMEDVAEKEQRTILFVSHQMAAIQKLCQKAIFLQNGSVHTFANVPQAISAYMGSIKVSKIPINLIDQRRLGSGEIRITKIRFCLDDNTTIDSAISGQDLIVEFEYIMPSGKPVDLSRVVCGIVINDPLGDSLIHTHNRMTGNCFHNYSTKGLFRVLIKKLPLPQGEYSIRYSLFNNNEYVDAFDSEFTLYVEDGDFYGTGEVTPNSHCKVLVDSSWSSENH